MQPLTRQRPEQSPERALSGIREKFAAARTEEVLSSLQKFIYYYRFESKYGGRLAMFRSQYQELRQQEAFGTLRADEKDVLLNRVKAGVLALIGALEGEYRPGEDSTPALVPPDALRRLRSRYVLILPFSIGVAGCLLTFLMGRGKPAEFLGVFALVLIPAVYALFLRPEIAVAPFRIAPSRAGGLVGGLFGGAVAGLFIGYAYFLPLLYPDAGQGEAAGLVPGGDDDPVIRAFLGYAPLEFLKIAGFGAIVGASSVAMHAFSSFFYRQARLGDATAVWIGCLTGGLAVGLAAGLLGTALFVHYPTEEVSMPMVMLGGSLGSLIAVYYLLFMDYRGLRKYIWVLLAGVLLVAAGLFLVLLPLYPGSWLDRQIDFYDVSNREAVIRSALLAGGAAGTLFGLIIGSTLASYQGLGLEKQHAASIEADILEGGGGKGKIDN